MAVYSYSTDFQFTIEHGRAVLSLGMSRSSSAYVQFAGIDFGLMHAGSDPGRESFRSSDTGY